MIDVAPGNDGSPWAASPGRPRAVVAQHLIKQFGGVRALDGVNIEIDANTIHALVGENGAGKSTFMNVLAGSITPDEGSLTIFDKPLPMGDVEASRAAGIGLMHQELRLFPTRSVLANLFAGRELRRRGLVDTRTMREIAEPVLARIGLECPLDAPVESLGLSERQLVELARVLIESPRVIMLDEPTSALNARESDRLMSILRELPEQGTTVIYVSHRLAEVFAIADQISVIRDGRIVMSQPANELDIPSVVRGIVGDAAAVSAPRTSPTFASTRTALRIEGLATTNQVSNASLYVQEGEVVGIAGLVGSGAEEILQAIFGATGCSVDSASYPDGRGVPESPTKAARRGIALVPADRKKVGVMLGQSIADNVSQVVVGARGAGSFFLLPSRLADRARNAIAKLGIKASGPDAAVSQLSGGNQQKVVIAKWLEIDPKLVLLDDPTRGVDIGAKAEIFRIVRDLAAQGTAVLLRSTEIPELIGQCDRIYIIKDGVITGEVSGVSEEELLALINEEEAA